MGFMGARGDTIPTPALPLKGRESKSFVPQAAFAAFFNTGKPSFSRCA